MKIYKTYSFRSLYCILLNESNVPFTVFYIFDSVAFLLLVVFIAVSTAYLPLYILFWESNKTIHTHWWLTYNDCFRTEIQWREPENWNAFVFQFSMNYSPVMIYDYIARKWEQLENRTNKKTTTTKLYAKKLRVCATHTVIEIVR